MRRCRHIANKEQFRWSALVAAFLLSAAVCMAQKSAVYPGVDAADPFKSSPGKIVVLVFVRTDCPVSNRYAPFIKQLSAKYVDKAAFWLVYPDKSSSAEEIRKHVREFGYTLPAVRDPQHTLVKQGEVQVTPEVAVFNTHQHLVYHGRIDNLFQDFGHARAAATTHELDDAIRAALAGTSAPEHAPGVGCYISDLE
jgi:thiol-disulfide isomerase/thioredoxin